MPKEREDPGQELAKYIHPTTIYDERVVAGLSTVGLSPEFPVRLRRLNDILATKPTQFRGLKFTVSPEQENPIPVVEVIRGRLNQITVDMDANPYDPPNSTGWLSVDNPDFTLAQQTQENMLEFVRKLVPDSPDTKVTLVRHHKVNDNPIDYIDFFSFTQDDYEELIKSWHGKCEVVVEGVSKPLLVLYTQQGGAFRKPVWNVLGFNYPGTATQIEETMDLLADFLSFDPFENPDITNS